MKSTIYIVSHLAQWLLIYKAKCMNWEKEEEKKEEEKKKQKEEEKDEAEER